MTTKRKARKPRARRIGALCVAYVRRGLRPVCIGDYSFETEEAKELIDFLQRAAKWLDKEQPPLKWRELWKKK